MQFESENKLKHQKMIEKLTINANKICEFPTFQNWINFALSGLGDYRKKGQVG